MKILVADNIGGKFIVYNYFGKHKTIINRLKKDMNNFIVVFKSGKVYDSFLQRRSCYRNKYMSKSIYHFNKKTFEQITELKEK